MAGIDRRGQRARLASLEQQRRSLIAALVKIDADIAKLRAGNSLRLGTALPVEDEAGEVSSGN